jgi:ribosome-binding factor A
MSRKQEQIAAELRELIQDQITRGLADPRISGLITVTDVSLSPDLRHATVLVSVLPHDRETTTLKGLVAASKHFRHEIGHSMTNRNIPELTFRLDDRLKKEAATLEAIRKANEAPKGEPGRF